MAKIICKKCGANYQTESPEGKTTGLFFVTTNFPAGSYLTVQEIADTGDEVLACPKDPRQDLDDAIRGDGSRFHPEKRREDYGDADRYKAR